MRKNYVSFAICFLFILSAASASGQATFSLIQNIMQAKCGNAGCHGGGSASVFDVDASAADLYNSLVNVPAVNAAAAEKGNKIADPGHPYNSFLLRKIGSNNFDPFITIDAAERGSHPFPLQNAEIELIRQWIIAGAQDHTAGKVVDYDLLQDYYANGGMPFIPVPPAPAAGKGLQVRMGPIFLAPNTEVEFMKKEFLNNTDELVISRMDGYMTSRSHHLLLFKFENSDADNYRQGIRKVPLEGIPFNGGQLTGAWQDDGEMKLPYGTAFKWQPRTSLDFDYHVTNVGNSQILPADFYLNVYNYEEVLEPVEMLAQLVNNSFLFLFEGDNVRTEDHIPGGGDRNIWLITSHTHKFGTDYDIYLRNPDGTKGEQIYEGYSNIDHTFNQGTYSWEHPPVRRFEYPLKKFNGNYGLIYETRWNVTGPCTLPFGACVSFGMTTADEMMLFTYLYTKSDVPEDPTGVEDVLQIADFSVAPNPFTESTRIDFSIASPAAVKLEVFDMLGKKIGTIRDGQLGAGYYSAEINSDMVGNKSGVYFVTLSLDGNKLATRKISKL